MSGERAEHVAQIQEAYLDDCYGSSFQLKVAAYWPEIAERLGDFATMQERAVHAEAALAAAREREQRLREALEAITTLRLDEGLTTEQAMARARIQMQTFARAALVDEPAAAMLVGKHPKRPGDDTVDLAEAVDAAATFVCPFGHRHHEGMAFCTVCGTGPVLPAAATLAEPE